MRFTVVEKLIRNAGNLNYLCIFVVFVNEREKVGIEILLMHTLIFFEQLSDSLFRKNALKKIEMLCIIINSVVKKSFVVHNCAVKIKKVVLL